MERLTKNVDGCNQIIDCGNDLCKETCEEWSCEFCPISKAIDKLADYEDAEEQGLLLRLPCKVGDTVYRLIPKTYRHIEPLKVRKFVICEKGLCFVTEKTTINYSCDEFGKIIFLTKEEAEQKLAEIRGDNNV